VLACGLVVVLGCYPHDSEPARYLLAEAVGVLWGPYFAACGIVWKPLHTAASCQSAGQLPLFPRGVGWLLAVGRWRGRQGVGFEFYLLAPLMTGAFRSPPRPPLREGVLGRASAWNPFESLDRRRRQGYGQDPNRTRVLARSATVDARISVAGLTEAILWPSPLRNWPGERVGGLARRRLGADPRDTLLAH
jgi:hypothetical protein